MPRRFVLSLRWTRILHPSATRCEGPSRSPSSNGGSHCGATCYTCSSNNWYSNETITSGCKQCPATGVALFGVLLVKQRNNGRDGGSKGWSQEESSDLTCPRLNAATCLERDLHRGRLLTMMVIIRCQKIHCHTRTRWNWRFPPSFEKTMEQIWIWLRLRLTRGTLILFFSIFILFLFIRFVFSTIYESK